MKKPTINSRIYYTLSPLGIFYVISKSDLISSELNFSISIKLLINNHPNNHFSDIFSILGRGWDQALILLQLFG